MTASEARAFETVYLMEINNLGEFKAHAIAAKKNG
jgi:hypothetical protein